MTCERHIDFPKGWRILVVGGDHHNTLASLRSLGRGGVPFDLLLHSGIKSADGLMVPSSKYCPKNFELVDNNVEAISEGYRSWLTDKDPRLCIVLASSDLSAYVADRELAPKGIITYSFSGEPGRVAGLMDKYEQYVWAKAHGVPMARSVIVTSRDHAAAGLGYPLILKPLVSAFGEKTDIAIVDSPDSYAAAVARLFAEGYERLLVQEVVDFDYEAVASGCIFLSNGKESHITLRKELTFPRKAGNVAIGRSEAAPEMEKLLEKVIDELSSEGFRGMFDIEIFATKDGTVLNEINFRQSGNMFACLDGGMSLPLLWALDAAGEVIYPPKSFGGRLRIVAEPQLVSGVTHGQIGVGTAIAAMAGADSFALRAKDDKAPSRRFFLGGFVAKLSKALRKKGR